LARFECLMRNLTAAAMISLAVACGSSPTTPDAPSIPDLQSAPTRVVMQGKTLVLGASLGRDFMPIAPPDGRPLAGLVRISAEDGSPVPTDISAATTWVIHGSSSGDIWTTSGTPQPRDQTAPALVLLLTGGPKWPPNDTVDVVVRLRDATGRVTLLRAPQQVIGASY